VKILLVGGRFDNEGGRASGYIDKLRNAIDALGIGTVQCFNAGSYDDTLRTLAETVVLHYDVVLWFAEVPNEKPKLVSDIKKRHPRCILVTAKRNERRPTPEYSFQEIMQHALKLKSNLVVQFRHDRTRQRITAEVFDPLGNCFMSSNDIQLLARVLVNRCQQLQKFTRVGSRQVGDRVDVPDQPEFFSLAKRYAEVFHDLLQPAATSRFLGNASFRCARGFPSFRDNTNRIFVSRRNIDKRYIGPEGFVAVRADALDPVEHYGEAKPSVDTPVQLRLYRYYHRINYIVHGHVYVKNAVGIYPYDNPVPCGAVEEALHLCYFSRGTKSLIVNIKHHGCLVMGATVEQLKGLEFVPRPAPESVTRLGERTEA